MPSLVSLGAFGYLKTSSLSCLLHSLLFLTLTRTPLTEPAVESGLRLPPAPPGPATLPRPPKMPQSMVACAIMQLTLSTILVVISKALKPYSNLTPPFIP